MAHAIATAAAAFGKLPDAAPLLPLPRANSEGAPVECMMAFVTGSSLNEEGEASGGRTRPTDGSPSDHRDRHANYNS